MLTNGTLRDAKRYLTEDMLLYGVIFLGDLVWDFLLNLAIAVNLYPATHEPEGHPYLFGFIQWVILIFATVQFARKWNDWRYT